MRNNLREKSKKQEVLRREKCSPLEKFKLKVMLKKPKKNILRNLSLESPDVYSLLTFYNLSFYKIKIFYFNHGRKQKKEI